MLKFKTEVRLPSPMIVTLCIVKRLEEREGHPNGKVWAFRVLPRLPDQEV